LLVTLWFCARYWSSPMGEALRAVKTNETRLDYIGLAPNAVLGFGYVASAALAGAGGAVSALNTGIVTPELAYWTRSAEFVFIAVMGGVGHIAGPVLGAIAFEGVKAAALSVIAGWWEFVLGAVLVLIVLHAPAGIAGLVPARPDREPAR
jgi:branched-chain amino acid transport system permease protein